MSSEKLLVIAAFTRAFDTARELGITVKVEPPTTPVPKDYYALCMKQLAFEHVGEADQRAINPQLKRETNNAN